MGRFSDQTVFVTGGNKGIGLGIARRFAEEGAKVAIAAIDKDTPEAASALAEASGANVVAYGERSLFVAPQQREMNVAMSTVARSQEDSWPLFWEPYP